MLNKLLDTVLVCFFPGTHDAFHQSMFIQTPCCIASMNVTRKE